MCMIVDMLADTEEWWKHVRRITALGEPLLELQPTAGQQIRLAFGGDVANSTTCLARILRTSGKEISLVTALGTGTYADWLRERLKQERIRLCEPPSEGEPGIYGLPIDSARGSEFSYWRDDSAARRFFRSAEMTQLDELLSESQLLIVTGITLALCSSESFEHLCHWIRLHCHHCRVVFDCNFRRRLWAGDAEARQRIGMFEKLASAVVTGFEDEKSVWASTTPMDIIRRVSRLPGEYVIRGGGEGCWVGLGENWRHIPAGSPPVIDTAGAGDAHLAGYIAARVSGCPRAEAAEYGNRVAAVIIRQRGSAPSPTFAIEATEIDAFAGFQGSTASGVIHERMVGNQRSRSKTLTARRCCVVSSGASITVGRRPGLPVAVRTSVARMSPRVFMV
jgi:2-dehydro-3-deoxygluconokinase